jgi:hypothetical protein
MKTIILKDCDGTTRKVHLAGNASDYATDDLIELCRVAVAGKQFQHGLLGRRQEITVQFDRYGGKKPKLLRLHRLTGWAGDLYSIRIKPLEEMLSDVEYLAAMGAVSADDTTFKAAMPDRVKIDLGWALGTMLATTSYLGSHPGSVASVQRVKLARVPLRAVKKRGKIDASQRAEVARAQAREKVRWELSEVGADLLNLVERKAGHIEYVRRRAEKLEDQPLLDQLDQMEKQLANLKAAVKPLQRMSGRLRALTQKED